MIEPPELANLVFAKAALANDADSKPSNLSASRPEPEPSTVRIPFNNCVFDTAPVTPATEVTGKEIAVLVTAVTLP